MLVSKAYLAVLSGKLTCGDVTQLLMEQPTTPVGRGVESHAHMHTMEGFRLNRAGFGGTATSFEKKQRHWESPSHLYPQGQAPGFRSPEYGRLVSAQGNPYYSGVVQNPNRLPPTREYADRTGLGQLPVVQGAATYRVFLKQPRGAPLAQVVPTLAGLDASLYITERNGTIRNTVIPGTIQTPGVAASPAHSMFPDTESQVMHLTAALLSDAGQLVLRYMAMNVPAGSPLTSGIFSKIAVQAVAAVDGAVPNQLVERRLEVDQAAPRSAVTGQYPATGRILTQMHGVDHVVVILGKSLAGDLNVLTYYPCRQTTGATVGTATQANEDIAELTIRQHTVVQQVRRIPRLRW